MSVAINNIIRSILYKYYDGYYHSERDIALKQLDDVIKSDLSEFYPSKVSKYENLTNVQISSRSDVDNDLRSAYYNQMKTK